MQWLYLLAVWIHVLAACAWVGSMLFFSAVLAPAMRVSGVSAARSPLMRSIGARYRRFGWASLAVLAVTGVFNLHARGIGIDVLSSAAFWGSSFGHTLAAKLTFIALVLAATTGHDVFMRSHRPPPDRESPAAVAYRRRASRLGRATLALSLLVVLFAVELVRGVP